MARLVITTIGTSIITNYLESSPQPTLKRQYERSLRNKPFSQGNSSSCDGFKTQIKNCALSNFPQNLPLTSAELASLQTMINLNMYDPNNDSLLFLCTDTLDGFLASEIQVEILRKIYPTIKLSTQQLDGVVSSNASSFVKGIIKMKEYLEEQLNGKINKLNSVMFNITGGYKGIIPALTLFCDRLMGNFTKHICYLHEDSQGLIEFQLTAEGITVNASNNNNDPLQFFSSAT